MKKTILMIASAALIALFASCSNQSMVAIGDKLFTQNEASRLQALEPQAQNILSNYDSYENPEEELIKLLKNEFGEDYAKYYSVKSIKEIASNSRATQYLVEGHVDITTDRHQPSGAWADYDMIEWKWAWASYVKINCDCFKSGLLPLNFEKLTIAYYDVTHDVLETKAFNNTNKVRYKSPDLPGNTDVVRAFGSITINDTYYFDEVQTLTGYKGGWIYGAIKNNQPYLTFENF